MTVEQRWKEIEQTLVSLDDKGLLLSAAFACERCIRHFSEFCKLQQCSDPDICSLVIEQGWKLADQSLVSMDFANVEDRLRNQAGELEESEEATAAAAAEGCYACMVLVEIIQGNRSPEQVARILRFNRDITDLLVQEAADFVSGDDLEDAVLRHPLMRREVELCELGLRLASAGSTLDEIRSLARS